MGITPKAVVAFIQMMIIIMMIGWKSFFLRASVREKRGDDDEDNNDQSQRHSRIGGDALARFIPRTISDRCNGKPQSTPSTMV